METEVKKLPLFKWTDTSSNIKTVRIGQVTNECAGLRGLVYLKLQ